MKPPTKHLWLKNRGYSHITPQLNVYSDRRHLLSKIRNKEFVTKHAFFPLIHSIVKERRYKKIPLNSLRRAHCYRNEKNKIVKNTKERPIHYATHIDSLIFGYYSELLQTEYEKELLKHEDLSDCITAYRKIKHESEDRNKSTIDFAHEVFEELKKRAKPECKILKFDIKSYFNSIDHEFLKQAWSDILKVDKLPKDHLNVYKAATHFSYILLDDLRVAKRWHGRRMQFDEKKLANIRKNGIFAIFESSKEFREKIKNREINVHKYPFVNKEGKPRGIPQGLPISSMLANLYLLEFDKKVLNDIVKKLGCYYRRYSDDIIVICNCSDATFIETYFMTSVIESKVEISNDKTEKFLFKQLPKNSNPILTSIKLSDDKSHINHPFTYLGFEFNGVKTLIKSANLAKFYRRMIYSVKRKANRAVKIAKETPNGKPVIFRNQLYKLYTAKSLHTKKLYTNKRFLEKNKVGDYVIEVSKKERKYKSNYLSYVSRASKIMGDETIKNQIAKHKKIFTQAIHKHLDKAIMSNDNI